MLLPVSVLENDILTRVTTNNNIVYQNACGYIPVSTGPSRSFHTSPSCDTHLFCDWLSLSCTASELFSPCSLSNCNLRMRLFSFSLSSNAATVFKLFSRTCRRPLNKSTSARTLTSSLDFYQISFLRMSLDNPLLSSSVAYLFVCSHVHTVFYS